MPSLNRVFLIGHLGRDPEIRYTSGGDAVANFSLATSEKWTKDGEIHEATEWHRIVAWRKTAEIVQKYAHKGSPLFVEGKIKTREWDDKDGNKRKTTEIVADRILLLGSKNNESTQEGQQVPEDQFLTEDDIPF